MSCSIPKTSTLFALRAAGVLGTFAQLWANGAAASAELLALPATLVVAVADAASSRTAAAAPARSQRRLCIESLRLICAGSLSFGGACSLPRPRKGAPVTFVRRRRGSLVRYGGRCYCSRREAFSRGAPEGAQTGSSWPGRAVGTGSSCGSIARRCWVVESWERRLRSSAASVLADGEPWLRRTWP